MSRKNWKTAMGALIRATGKALAVAAGGLLLALAATTAHAGAVLSSGVTTIGVNDQGNLIFQGVGLRYVPTGGEALAPGCFCEGWGVADVISRSFGKAGEVFGKQNVVVESFTKTSSTAKSVVRIVNGTASVLRVTHDFRVSPQTANLFEAIVTIENISAATVDLRYRRAMDWDVPPTTFSELVTIVTNGAQDVVFSSDNGFADGNPLNAAGSILFTGERANSGPADHGAVFDFNLGTLEPGKSRVFSIFYGAAAHEPAALQALAAIGPEVYSLGKPNTPSLTPSGSPNTFIFAFKGVGGTPAIVRDADLTIGGLDMIDNGNGQPLSVTARLGNAGGQEAKTFRVSFYDGDPAQPGAILLGTRDIVALASEDFVDLRIDGIATLSGKDLFAVADPERKVRECSLTNNVVSMKPQPRVVLGSIVAGTDKPSYGPNAAAVLSAVVSNPGRFAYDYNVRLRVEDAAGALVTQFDLRSLSAVAAGTSAVVNESWNTTTLAAGSYRLVADLFDAAGNELATSTADFTIETGVPGSSVAAAISTDKGIYGSLETVKVADRIVNRTVNSALEGLTAVTTVLHPDGTTFFTISAALDQIPAGGDKALNYSVPLGNALPGTYRAVLSVRDSTNAEQASSETTFVVQSAGDSGAGLRGSLSAAPKEVPQGDPVSLVASVNNDGNAAVSALPVKVSIVDGETGVLLKEFAYTADIVKQGRFDIATTWNTSPARVGATLVAVLSAEAGGKTISLARDTFTILPPPIKLEVTQAGVAKGRVLVLLSCQFNRNGGADDDDGTDDSAGNRDQACLDTRVTFVKSYLDELGVTYRITTDRDEFRRLFRSGAYNVYWLSGGGNKLKDPLADEVHEAVFRGDALILDGVHDNRNKPLDEVVGIKHIGKLSPVDQTIVVNGALFPNASLATEGRPLRVQLEDGVEQARFTGTAYAAIVSRSYGLGRGLLFSFDLVGSLQKAVATGGDAAAAWKAEMQAAFGYAAPAAQSSTTAGGYADLRTLVKNLARPVEVEVILAPPAGAQVTATEPLAAVGADGRATWRFMLAADATATLDAQLRLPSVSGTYTATTTVNTVRDGVPVEYQVLTTTLQVAAKLPQAGAVIASLKALIFADRKDEQARDKAVKEIENALDELAKAQHEKAIKQLVDAVAYLEGIGGQDMSSFIVEVDLLIKEAGRKWYEAQPGVQP